MEQIKPDMLQTLNDDCLRLIIELLHLEDQIAIALVSQRFKETVIDIWKRNRRKVTVTRDQFEYFADYKEYFVEYMRCVSEHVENLELENIDESYFDDLKDIQFPKVRTLCMEMKYSGKEQNDCVKIMTKIFPKVTSLKIYGGITGAYLSTFVQLEDLNLNCCEDLRTKYFRKIFSKLKLKKLFISFDGYVVCLDDRINNITNCKTLEEICIDDHHLVMIYENLFKLERLRKITCYTQFHTNYVLKAIVERFGNVLDTVVFNDCFCSETSHCESVERMVALRRLVFYNDEIMSKHLKAIGLALSNTLEEFCYLNGCLEDSINYEGLLDLVRQCKKLKILDLTGTDIDVSFPKRVAEILILEHSKRAHPLLIRCRGTKITSEHMKTLELPDELEISFEYQELELTDERYFQCEWPIQSNCNS